METYPYPKDPTKYQILELIGAGDGGSSVFRATCALLDGSTEQVAVKEVELETPKEFEEAAMAHSHLLAPHCTFMEVMEDETAVLWVVMPLARCSLKTVLAAHPNGLPENMIVAALKQILSGLVFLHSNNQVHRDLKATNVLVGNDGILKLSDTGVSESHYRHDFLGEWANTPYWLPPEKGLPNEKGDVYALGVLALEMAYGRAPTFLPTAHGFSHEQEVSRFSEPFKILVGSFLEENQSLRPTADLALAQPPLAACSVTTEMSRFLESVKGSVPLGYRVRSNDYDNVLGAQIAAWKFNAEEFKLYPIIVREREKGLNQLRQLYIECWNRLFPNLLAVEKYSELKKIQRESLLIGFVPQYLTMFFKETERALTELDIYLGELSLDFNRADYRTSWTRIICKAAGDVKMRKVTSKAYQLLNLSQSMGSQRLVNVSSVLLKYCFKENVEVCFECLKVFKKVLKLMKVELKTLIDLEKRIKAGGGAVPKLS